MSLDLWVRKKYFNYHVLKDASFLATSPAAMTTAPPPPVTPSPPTGRCTRRPGRGPATCQTCPTTPRQRSRPQTAPVTTAPSRPGPASTSLCRGSRQPRATTSRWPRGRTRCPPTPRRPGARVLMCKDEWRRPGL